MDHRDVTSCTGRLAVIGFAARHAAIGARMARRAIMTAASALCTIAILPAAVAAQRTATDDAALRSAVAGMVHTRTDVAWLFDPVTLAHMEITAADRHDADQVVALAGVARSRGLADRPDVRAARAAADTLILAEAERRSLVDSLRPSDADVARAIAARPGRYAEYRLRHIFVAIGPTRSEAEALELARRIRARILAGERFETVAAAVSEDASTASEGGALSALLGTTMDEAFLPSVQALPVGKITDPIRGPQGFHILKLESRQPLPVGAARYWVEQDIIRQKLPSLIAEAIASARAKDAP